jgi:hypothetical protein
MPEDLTIFSFLFRKNNDFSSGFKKEATFPPKTEGSLTENSAFHIFRCLTREDRDIALTGANLRGDGIVEKEWQ